jgi:hypothetical protein
MTFLQALHASRRCQAAREIHRYRHLIDDANAGAIECSIARGRLKVSRCESSAEFSTARKAGTMTNMMHAPQSDETRSGHASDIMPRSQAGRMSRHVTILIAGGLVVFAVLHLIGGTMLMVPHTYSPEVLMFRGD